MLAVSQEEYKGKIIAHMMGEEAPELASLGDIIYFEINRINKFTPLYDFIDGQSINEARL